MLGFFAPGALTSNQAPNIVSVILTVSVLQMKKLYADLNFVLETYGYFGKFVIYSEDEVKNVNANKTSSGRVLATFDYLGNGEVYSHDGKLRLVKYSYIISLNVFSF